MQLLTIVVYGIDMLMMNKQDPCEGILPPKLKNGTRASNKRPKNIERGCIEVASSVDIPASNAIRYNNQGLRIKATKGSTQKRQNRASGSTDSTRTRNDGAKSGVRLSDLYGRRRCTRPASPPRYIFLSCMYKLA